MIQKVCDRCRKEIRKSGIVIKTGTQFLYGFIPKKDYDLCYECTNDFYDFISKFAK